MLYPVRSYKIKQNSWIWNMSGIVRFCTHVFSLHLLYFHIYKLLLYAIHSMYIHVQKYSYMWYYCIANSFLRCIMSCQMFFGRFWRFRILTLHSHHNMFIFCFWLILFYSNVLFHNACVTLLLITSVFVQ